MDAPKTANFRARQLFECATKWIFERNTLCHAANFLSPYRCRRREKVGTHDTIASNAFREGSSWNGKKSVRWESREIDWLVKKTITLNRGYMYLSKFRNHGTMAIQKSFLSFIHSSFALMTLFSTNEGRLMEEKMKAYADIASVQLTI